jgi:DNA-binding response OmpR family regulator
MLINHLKILIVEDEPAIGELLKLHFSDLGAIVTLANDGHQGLSAIRSHAFDIAILDIQLPGPCGLSLCRQLRQQQSHAWIMLLTSRSTEIDKVLGLEQGADDYITKPFSVMEMIARVKACCRRSRFLETITVTPYLNPTNDISGKSAQKNHISCGQLTINLDAREVLLNSQAVELTSREFDLLVHFVKKPNCVFNRSQLLDQVWGYGHDGYEHTVNSHINRLRAKIEKDPAHPSIIVTVWGVGYKLINTE